MLILMSAKGGGQGINKCANYKLKFEAVKSVCAAARESVY